MSTAHSDAGNYFSTELDQLSREIRDVARGSLDSTFEHVCNRLSVIDPISSAGFFRADQPSQSLEWIHLSELVTESMTSSLQQHQSSLSAMLNGGERVHSLNGNESIFIGLPAGPYNGTPIGLGLTSRRELENDELTRLGSFGMLAGLIAENLRLSQLVAETDEAGSTARLIGFIAHELRTPLTGMRGNIQLAMMANRKGQHDRIPDRLEAAINGVDNMSALVQKLLDVSRLERGAFPLTVSHARLSDTLNEAVESFQTDVSNDDVTVQFDGELDTRISADHAALTRAISLLLATASGYLDGSPQLQISVHGEDASLQIDITFTGSPFSGDDIAAISEPLSGTQSSTERHENLSLDLAYCRGIIRQHNGSIRLQTEKPAPGQQTIQLQLARQVE